MRLESYAGKKMLVVVAHPDDETFGMGGTLALYAHLGVEIYLICATRGEVGEVKTEKLEGFASIGELREHELRCAADVLGLQKVHFLGYRDSGMSGSDENKHPDAFINALIGDVARKIAVIIREIKPEVVLTFDPIGGYMHPDHIAAHKATVAAFNLAGDESFKTKLLKPFKPKKLYFHIIPRVFLNVIVRIMPLFGVDPSQFGKNKDIDLTAVLAENFPTHARINYRKYAAIRDKASACYASQGGDKGSGYIVAWIIRLFRSVETYMRAYPRMEDNEVERDLFSGI
ncbi:MAG: PIG-L family deacetylase [Anaerolineaceae bacterium]|nr:PIG-L family deacetylase [Anaerolineaceae bacterium]